MDTTNVSSRIRPTTTWQRVCAKATAAVDAMDRLGSSVVAPTLQRTLIPASLPFSVASSRTGAIRPDAPGAQPSLHDVLADSHVQVYAVRHGETEANAAAPELNPILAGQSETPLTARGQEQARQAAVQLYQDLGGDALLLAAGTDPSKLPVVYAGPLSRAHDTAQATVSYLVAQADRLAADGQLTASQHQAIVSNLTIHTDPRLTEIGFGQFEMHTGTQLMASHPMFALDYNVKAGLGVDFLHRFPGGESRMDVMNRMNGFLRDVAQQHPGRTVLLFSHNETIDCAQVLLDEAKTSRSADTKASLIPNATPLRLV